MRGEQIYRRLEQFYRGVPVFGEVLDELKRLGMKPSLTDFYDPFKNLVIGILSQNTSDRNSVRAYASLKRALGDITLESIRRASLKEIERAIKVGGLWRIKARRIKELADALAARYGSAGQLLKLGERAKEELVKLPGIGEKTADVFVAYCIKAQAFPIDTNIARVAKRLGICRSKSYRQMNQELKDFFPRHRWVRVHELLLRLGRDFCRARKASCKPCPVNELCPKL
jgi:endonuclease-3